LLLVSIVTVTGACARRAMVANGRPAASASHAPVAIAAAGSGAADARDEEAETPGVPIPPSPGVDRDEVIFASSICAAAYMGRLVGCRSHPPFVRPEQKPDGKLAAFTGDPLELCAIEKVSRGSFTRPGATQALLGFGPCKDEPRVTWDMANPGSVVLVEQIEGRWKAIGYEDGVNSRSCFQVRRSSSQGGRDILLCRSSLGAFTAGQVFYFFMVDFGRTAKRAATIARLYSDMAPSCMSVDRGFPSGYVELEIAGVTLSDVNADGTNDLVVRVKRARVPPSPSFDAKVRAMCKRRGPSEDIHALLPPAEETTIELVSGADGYAPSPASQKTLAKWRAEAPDDFNGLVGVGPPDL
jgi:hypothetical protein